MIPLLPTYRLFRHFLIFSTFTCIYFMHFYSGYTPLFISINLSLSLIQIVHKVYICTVYICTIWSCNSLLANVVCFTCTTWNKVLSYLSYLNGFCVAFLKLLSGLEIAHSATISTMEHRCIEQSKYAPPHTHTYIALTCELRVFIVIMFCYKEMAFWKMVSHCNSSSCSILNVIDACRQVTWLALSVTILYILYPCYDLIGKEP